MRLDAHQRAVYRLHSALSQDIGEKRVYYVVGQVDEVKFRVRAVRYSCQAPKQPLNLLLPDDENVQCFSAQGPEILRVVDGMGRFNLDQTTMLHNIDLTPLCLPEVA